MIDPDADVPAGVDFRDPAACQKWLEHAESARPWRPDFRRRIAELVRDSHAGPLRILELGAGPGLLAETILATCEVASLTLLDFSSTFLAMCRARLPEHVELVLADFKGPSWPTLVTPTFDAVVTMQAVHELRHKKHAAQLYRHVLPLMRPGGILVVCDHERKEGDARATALHATAAEQHEAMTSAGFTTTTTHVLDHSMYVCSARAPRRDLGTR